jgi:glutathione S-transferase
MTIWHLALESDWTAAVAAGSYRVSTRGLTLDEVGFIHGSSRDQVAGVAARFYSDVTEPLRLLVIDADAVRASGTAVVLEDAGDGELFPHIYGPIDTAWVREATPAHIANGLLVVD